MDPWGLRFGVTKHDRPPSFWRKFWATVVAVGGAAALYFWLGARQDSTDLYWDRLGALSGVFVAFFALIVLQLELTRDQRELHAKIGSIRRVDQRLSALAYQVSRQLKVWQSDVHVTNIEGELTDWIAFAGDLATEGGTGRDLYDRTLKELMSWWGSSGLGQNTAEARLYHMTALAPDASDPVADAVRTSFVKFYSFAGKWNHELNNWKASRDTDWRELVAGLQALDEAINTLEEVIAEDLRRLRDEVIEVKSPFEELAAEIIKLQDEAESGQNGDSNAL